LKGIKVSTVCLLYFRKIKNNSSFLNFSGNEKDTKNIRENLINPKDLRLNREF